MYSQTLLQFFSYLIIIPKLFPRTASFGALNKLKSEKARSASDLCDYFLCFQTCVWSCVVVNEDFSNTLCSSTLQKLFCKVLRVRVYRSELVVSPHGIIYQNHPFCPPPPLCRQNRVHDFPCWRGSLECILPRRSWWCYSIDCIFVCCSKWKIHVHPQWWSVTFTITLATGKKNLSSSLSAQFCDSWLDFVETKEQTFLNIQGRFPWILPVRAQLQAF